MVFTRSTIHKTYFLMHNAEMDRIRTEYASSDDDEEKVKAQTHRLTRKYTKKVLPSVESCPSFVSFPDVYSVNIDFDDAHDAWMANKKRKANGDYGYLCGAPVKSGLTCKRYCIDKIGLYSGCRTHYSWEESAHKMN